MRLSKYISRICFRLAARRFKAYRVLRRGEGLILRSVIIEDSKRKRFFEVSHDETFSSRDLEEQDLAYQERITELSDILTCISRMTFDVFLYERMSVLKGGVSIEEAMKAGSRDRQEIWDQLSGAATMTEGGPRMEPSEPELFKLTPYVLKSSNESALTPEDLIQQLSHEVREKTGRNEAYWRVLWKDYDGRELQALTFMEASLKSGLS